MAEYVALMNRMRQDLGKSYSVAEEHPADPLSVCILVRRQRRDETLAIAVDARWLAILEHGDVASVWSEYRSLGALITSFFAHPEALPGASFEWPGTPQSRRDLSRVLNARRRPV